MSKADRGAVSGVWGHGGVGITHFALPGTLKIRFFLEKWIHIPLLPFFHLLI